MKTYRRKQVNEITGIPERRIAFYVKEGIIPLDDPHPGRGVELRFTETNLIQIAAAKEMAEAGIELSRIKDILRVGISVRRDMFDPKTYKNGNELLCMVIYKKQVFFGKTKPRKVEIGEDRDFFLTDMTDSRHAVIINMTVIVKELF